MHKDDKRWLVWAVLAVAVAAAAPVVVLKTLGGLDNASDKRLAAVLTLVGVTLTASVSLIGALIRRQSERRLEREHGDEQARLRLDAAMQAGTLLNSNGASPADPAAVASGLLALTQLARAALAVALLVDLWDRQTEAPGDTPGGAGPKPLSDETAMLVLDAALRSSSPSAQLVAPNFCVGTPLDGHLPVTALAIVG